MSGQVKMASSEAAFDPLAKEDDSPLRLSSLRDEYKNELLEILDGMRGKKCLVMDAQLSSLLNMVVLEGSKLLKDSGVNFFRELKGEHLGDFTIDSGRAVPENIVYLVRPNLNLMKIIAKQILNSAKNGIRSQYHIYFVPHRTLVCEQMLEDEGISLDHDGVRIGEFRMGMIPFDTDILSLEMGDVFKQCYVDGDTSPLNAAARSLLQLQNLYGLIPQIRSKGAAARKVLQKLLHLRREEDSLKQEKQISYNSMKLIDTLVVMDREVDLISPLITPLTYEGLIDEVIGIENGKIKLDSSIINDGKDEQLPIKMPNVPGMELPTQSEPAKRDTTQPGDVVTVTLNSSDLIYSEIRDLSIERMGPFLQERAIKIRKSYANFRDNKDASITEIHDFVKKIPALTKEYKSLNEHINIAELIKQTTDGREFREQWQSERGVLEGEMVIDQIEDLICADTDRTLFYKVLRMLCLQSVTAGGIRSNKYDNIKKLIIQTYGYEQMFTLNNLERTGLLRRKDLMLVETASVWQGLRQKLRLIDERNLSKADDISYVSAGYAPLSVRLIQLLGNNSWTAIADVMRLLPGPLLEFNQIEATEELAEAIVRCGSDANSNGSSGGSGSSNIFNSSVVDTGTGNKKVMLLFIIGGLTYLEIAALRLLSRDPIFPYTIIMATTKIINGNTLLKTMVSEFKAP